MSHSYLLNLVSESCKEEIATMNEPTYEQSIKVKDDFESWMQRMDDVGKSVSNMRESDQFLLMCHIKIYLKCRYTHPEVFI